VARLDENIKELNKKIDDLKLAQEKGTKKAAVPRKAAATKKETAEDQSAVEAKTEE
jgi:hypothetical protein